MSLAFGLTAYWSGKPAHIAAFERLPATLLTALDDDWGHATSFFAGSVPTYIIGRGPGLGIAAEVALKLKETCVIHAEALSGAELQHGPLALADGPLRALILAPNDQAQPSLLELAGRLTSYGTDVIVAAPTSVRRAQLRTVDDPEPAAQLLAMLLRFYLMVNTVSLKKGRNPDNPPLLEKVTRTL